jgi:hypothetical protein
VYQILILVWWINRIKINYPPHVSGPTSVGTTGEPEIPLSRSEAPHVQITELASGAITAVDTVTIELVEADETPVVVIVRWPAKATVSHPRRFRLARILLPASSPPSSSWRSFDGSNGYEPYH